MARARRWLAALAAVAALLGAAAAHAAFTFTRISSPTFYTDTSVTPELPCNYVGFAVTSSTAVADGWAAIGSFSANLGTSGFEDGYQHLGSFSAGQTKYAYFYVCSSYTTVGGVSAGEGYTVSMYDRNPALAGASSLGSQAFTTTISNDVIQANPNQVSVIFAGPNPAVLGGIITMTVEGDTGTIGDAPGPQGPLAFTPAAFSDWRADAYELVSANVTLSGGNSGSYDNQLYLASLASSSTTHYVVTYQFRAITTTSTATNLSPIAEIASGTQVKHTSTTSGAYGGQLLPIDSATNTLRLSKLVSAATLPNIGGTVTYTLRLTNTSAYTIMVDDFVDTLPGGVTYVNGSSTYGGVAIANPFQTGQQLTWNSTFTVPGNSSRDLVFQAVIPATAGLYTNSAIAHIGPTIIDTTLTTSDNSPATASTRVLGPAAIAKSFTPVAAAAGNPITLTLTLTNNNTATTLTGLAVNDPYPAGLVNHSTPNASTTCTGGTITGGLAGGNSVGISGVTLNPGASCTLTVDVTSATSAAYTNTTGNVTSANGGSGGSASALVTFTSKPALTKSFTPASVPLGSTSRVAIVVTNNNTVSLTGLAFSDPLPGGMTVAATPNLTNTCGGSVTGATSGSSNVALSGGVITLPATSCQVAFDVTANAAGTYSNVTTGATSNETGTAGPVSNAAVLTVMAPPAVTKAFNPTAIARNETGTLTITLSNPNAAAITGVAFTDTYPAGLTNASIPATSTTCGGTVTAAALGGSVALSGGTIPAGGTCTVSVNVTSATAGTYNNTIAIGGVTSTNAGSSTVAAPATLTVTNKPTIAKAFAVNLATGVTTMTITVTNNHTTGLTGVAFSDAFPSGMVVDATPTLTNSCGGTVTGATAGSTSLALSAGAIGAAGGSCTISLRVAVNTSGEYANQATGVSSTQTGTAGNPSNVAMLVAPGLTKTFSPGTIGPGDVSRMTVTVTNPSGSTPLTGLQFTDTYPAGLVNTGTPAVANTCGGSTTGGAAAGTTFGLTGGSLAAGATCSISINVTSNTVNSYYNQTGTVRSNQGVGTDGADTLYVTARPTITKSFSPAAILAGGFSTMTLVVENNHSAGITGLAFSDPFPAGLVVRTPASSTNTCGGTLTAAAGGNTVSLSGGAIATANGTCTITVQVTAASQGTYANQTNGATSTTTGATPGPRSNIANLQVNLPAPTVAKSFSPATVGVNMASTLTITLTNGAAEAVTGVNLTDTYPAGLVNSGSNNLATTCGGVATAAGGTGSLELVGGSIPANGSCTLTVSVEAATAGSYLNNTGDVATANAGTATGASATLTVLAALSATKSFAASPIGINTPVALSIVITNPNAQAATGVAFTDNYPAGLVNATPASGAISGAGCVGTVTAANAGTSVALSGATIPAGGSCTVTVNVQAAAAGTYVNSIASGAITSANAGSNAAAASSTLAVLGPLNVAKAFAPASIGTNDTSVLTITLTNPNAVAVTGAAFTDTYPANLVNTASANAATTCTPATVTGTNGGNSVALSGATVPPNGSCTVTVNVTSATAGTYNNSTGAVTTTDAGTATAGAASLVVLAHPTASKTFAPASVAPNATSVLTITITNPNATALAGVAFTDTYPAGLVNTATPAGAISGTGCSGTVTAAAGGNTLVLANGAVPANGSCTVTANVTAAAAGSYANTLPANAITTTNAGAVTAATTGTLVVTSPLTVAKAFAPLSIGTGDTSVVTITLTNPNTVALTNVAFTDTYPANLVNTAAPAGASSCGGTVTAAAAGTSLMLSGATIAAGATCTITASVTSATAGSYLNSTGAVTADNAAASAAATATLEVLSHVAVTKSFTPATLGVNEVATLTIRLTNPNATTALTGAAFTDTYVANLLNASPTGLVNGCGGTASATAGSNSVSLSGGTVPAGGFCEISVNVTSATAGSYVNTLAAGAVTTTNGGSNTAAGSSTLTVLARPTITKAFGTNPIALGGTSTLTVTLTNPNAGTAITGAAFTDTYPANVVNSATPNPVTACGGSVTAAAGGGALQLTGGTIPAGGSCTVTVQVTATASGSHVNTIAAGALATTNAGGNSVAATDTLNVNARPTIAKAFAPNPVAVGGTSVLTITVTNPNSVAISGAAFTDTYPSGLVNAGTPGGSIGGAGCVGAVSAVAGAGSVALSGGTIPANASCTVTVNVTPTASGSLVNTIAAGALTTSNAGSNAAAATDTLTSLARPTVTKSFAPNPAAVGAPVTLTIALGNTNGAAISGVAFTDTYPANLVNTATPAAAITGTGCSGTLTAAAGGSSLVLAAGVIPANGTCTVTVNVQATAAGNLANTLAASSVTSTNAGSNSVAATDTLSAFAALVAAKSFSPATVGVNAPSVLTINLTNGNAAAATGVAFTDSYPSGLVNTGTPNAAITGTGCSGTLTATAGGNSLVLAGGTVPGNGSCVVTVNVTSATPGSYVNSTGPVTTANAGTAPADSATLAVLARPTVTKAFAPNPISVNGTSVLTVTLGNSNGAAIAGVAFTDTYPAGLVNAATPAGAIAGSGCVGTVTAAAAGNTLAVTGATIPANGTCTVTVNVTSAASGSYVNTLAIGAVTSTNASSNAVAATDTLVVMAHPTVTKAFAPNPIAPGGTSVLTFTITNTNATAITGAAFTDTYPANLVNTATPAGAINGASCTGTITATAGGNSAALSAGNIPANASCTVTVNVTSATPGSYVNTLAAGALTTTNAGTNAAAATDTLNVNARPTITKSFAPNPVAVDATSVLAITIGNSNPVAVTGAAFTDTYPANLVNAATPAGAISGTGCAGTVTAVAGAGSVALSGGTIPAGGSCTVTVNVTPTASGSLANTLAAGALTTTNAGSNAAAASDTLTALGAPTVTKSFTPASIALGGSSVLAVTITNPNATAITGAAFTDNYVANLVNAATPAGAITGAGCVGTVNAAAGGTSLALSGGTIPASGSCTISVNVTPTAAGTFANTLAAGAVTTTNAGSNTAAANSTLTVMAAPTVAKAFSPNPVSANANTRLSITITNPNATAITGAAFTDTYPANVVNAAAPQGAITGAGCTGTVTAVAGGGNVSLSSGTIPANTSCVVGVDVVSATAGSYTNTIPAGGVTTTNAGSNTVAATEILNVLGALNILKDFTPSTIGVNGASVLTITLTNQNNGNVNGVAFTDTYPAGLVNTATANPTHNCALGTVTAANNGNSLSFSAGRVNGNSSCTITVNVTSATAGTYTNTTSALTTSNAGTAPAASAILTVMARPAGTKSFAPSSIGAGGTSTLSITITNANATPLTNVAFTDTYPANLVNAAAPGGAIVGAGCLGTVTAAAGGSSAVLSGATIPANASCTVTVSVTSNSAGSYTNTIAAGGITSNEAGASTAAVSGTLTVLARPTLAKAFSPTTVGVNQASTLTLTLGNPNGVAITGAEFTDTYPANLVNAPTPAASSDCPGASITVAAGAGSIAVSGATIPAGGSCTVTVSVLSAVMGSYANTVAAGGLTTDNAGSNAAAATATLDVLSAASATKAFAPPSIAVNGSSVVTIVITNNNGFAITGAGFTDNYPSGLVNTGAPAGAITGAGCAGTVTAAAGANSLTLSGATIPANGSCTITANVTAAAAGSYVNSTGSITSGNAGTGTAASGALLVFAAPTVTKSFSPNAIAGGATSTMTIVVTNPAANPAPLTGVAISDTYPAGLTNAAVGSVSCSAGGSATLTGGANGGAAVGLSGGTIAAGGTCTITQLVTANATVTNTTGTATSNEAPAGTAAAATLTVHAAPTIAKAFSPATVALGATSTLTFTIGNTNTIALTGGAFTDAMTGMVIDANGAAGGTCAGAAANTFTANQSNLSFTGLTVPATGSCTVTVVVRATSAGTLNNTTSGVSTNQAATGAPSNTAQLTVSSGSPTVAKSFTPSTIDPGATSQLVITIGNPNAAAITVTTVSDNFPAGLSPAAVPNAGTTCAGGSVSTTAGSVTLTGGTVPAGGACTVTLEVTSASSGQALVNTIPAGNLTTSVGANAAAGSATLNVRPAADVSVTKTGPANVAAGATVTYTIVVSNAGPQSADGAVFSDTVPAAVLGVAASCGLATGGAVCGGVNVAGNAITSTITTLPAGASVTFTVTGTAPTSGSFTNTAQVLTSAAVYDPTDPTRVGNGNNRSSVTTTVASPDLAITKTHAGNFTVGTSGTYTITVNNTAGSAPTTGSITVTDNLPNGLAFVSGTGTGWSCSAVGQAVTCSTSSVIAAGATGNAITLTVSVGAAAAPSVTNTASVAGGGEPAAVAGNNNASDPTTVASLGTSTFVPDNTLTASAGTTVNYPHTFTAGAAGTVTFSTSSVQSPVVVGWTQTIYRDSDCSGTLNGAEGTAPIPGGIAVNAGDQVCIIVRDAIPLSAPQNAQNAITVSATLNAQALSRTDLTIVGAGSGAGLVLNKQVRNLTQGGAFTTTNTARPNDVLEYTVTYTNTGGGPITAIVVTDSTPSFTLYQAASCTLPLPSSITACSVTTQPAVNGTGSISWTLAGSLQSGASGTVTFTVRVQP